MRRYTFEAKRQQKVGVKRVGEDALVELPCLSMTVNHKYQ